MVGLLNPDEDWRIPPDSTPLPGEPWPSLLQPPPNLADTADTLVTMRSDYLARKTREEIEAGLRDPVTGALTDRGWKEQARVIAMGFGSPDLGMPPIGSIRSTRPVPGFADQVSTRVPTSVKVTTDPHTTPDMRIGIDAFRSSGDAVEKNTALLRNGIDKEAQKVDPTRPEAYPDLPVARLSNPDSIADRSVAHMTDNLKFLHNTLVDQFGQPLVNRSSLWYDGANRIATRLANDYGYEPRQAAALLANLSPQKDWYQNADLGRCAIDIINNQGRTATTPEMAAWLDRYLAVKRKEADTPIKQAKFQNLEDATTSLKRGRVLSDINDPDQRSLWVRAYDGAHNPREYPIVTPEGGFGGPALNDNGSPARIGWGSFKEIEKALSALDSPELAALSRSLGGNHKVRSFYNNIISPNSPFGHTTIDTHAIAAAHLRPLAGEDFAVKQGLGLAGSNSNLTGSKGTYGLYHEAYRQAAADLGILPRQLQSITWEGVRGLYEAAQKRNPALTAGTYDTWRGYRLGRQSIDDTRKALLDQAGGITPPSWWNVE